MASSSAPVGAGGLPHPRAAAPTTLNKLDFQVLFPQYIDATLTPKQGRRLTKTQAVETPTIPEMLEALHALGYRRFVRDAMKSYPRSQSDPHFPMPPKECIRVPIKAPKDVHYIKKSEFDLEVREPTVSGIDNKMELLRRVAAWIKEKNPTRPTQASVEEVLAAIPNPLNPVTKSKTKKIKK